MSLEFLQKLPLFAGMPEEDLQRLHDLAEPIDLDAGDVLMREGSREESLYLVLAGRFEISKRSGEKDVVIAVRGAGEVMGEMSVLSEAPRSATVTSLGPARLLRLDKEAFQSVLRSSSEATLAILETVTERLQNTEAMLRHHEKLSALGTLAAGLAHEINNPAGAIERSADQLGELVLELTGASERVGHVTQTEDQRAELERLRERSTAARPVSLDGLEQSDREAELEDWLESVGVDEAWRFVRPLVAHGWAPEDLTSTPGVFEGENLTLVVSWLAQVSEARDLTSEVAQAAERISSIVQSVKDFTYLDQAPEQVIDLHKGIEDTLVILRHKLGDGILIKKEFETDLPRVEGFGSELTQVWTNLIDNAIDAMDGEGTLTLRTSRHPEGVRVSICDDGPGIPRGQRERIFEPFYTTKPPGVGTGLGLHLAYNVVVQRHKGSIEVESEPGRTCFKVTLPSTA